MMWFHSKAEINKHQPLSTLSLLQTDSGVFSVFQPVHLCITSSLVPISLFYMVLQLQWKQTGIQKRGFRFLSLVPGTVWLKTAKNCHVLLLERIAEFKPKCSTKKM